MPELVKEQEEVRKEYCPDGSALVPRPGCGPRPAPAPAPIPSPISNANPWSCRDPEMLPRWSKRCMNGCEVTASMSTAQQVFFSG